jgi:hypothetical protein
METLKTENRTAFAQAIKRRDGAMREMLGMGSDSVGDTEGDKHHKPQVGIWRIPGNPDRSGAGWTDTVDARVQRREDRRLRRRRPASADRWSLK